LTFLYYFEFHTLPLFYKQLRTLVTKSSSSVSCNKASDWKRRTLHDILLLKPPSWRHFFSFVNLKVFFLLSFFSWCKTTHVFLEMLIVVFVSGRHKFNISVKISEPTSYTSCTIPDWITSTYTSIMINSWRLLTTFHSIDLHNESLRIFD